jgi:hypothetical protein
MYASMSMKLSCSSSNGSAIFFDEYLYTSRVARPKVVSPPPQPAFWPTISPTSPVASPVGPLQLGAGRGLEDGRRGAHPAEGLQRLLDGLLVLERGRVAALGRGRGGHRGADVGVHASVHRFALFLQSAARPPCRKVFSAVLGGVRLGPGARRGIERALDSSCEPGAAGS